MRNPIVTFVSLFFAAALGATSIPQACNGPDRLTVREWIHTSTFPESDDPDFKVAEVVDRKNESFAIAFSGGGTRSASATLGQLRALHDRGWLERAQYISAVSGGSWAAIPYTFLPQKGWTEDGKEEEISDRTFLGAYLAPGKITADLLGQVPDRSYAKAISSAKIPGLYLSRLFWRSDETFSRALGKKILREFDLYEGERRHKCEGPARMVAAHAKQRAWLQRNATVERPNGGHRWRCLCPDGADGTDLCDDEFLLPRPGRPFLIVGSTVFAKQDGKNNVHMVELTPLYSGSRTGFDLSKKGDTVRLGGGFIESAAYDSSWKCAPDDGGDPTFWNACFKRALSEYRYRQTPSDMMGASGAAPVALLRSLGFKTLGFPAFYTRPIGDPSQRVIEIAHGDGGHADDLGLTPLLARGVRNILAFANSLRPFCPQDQDCPQNKGLRMAADIQCFFEQRDAASEEACERKRRKKNAAVPALFAADGFDRILAGFEALKAADRPLVYCDTFEMLPAQDLPEIVGLIEPYSPRICWVQLDFTEAWIQQVAQGAGGSDERVRNLVERRGKNFRNFPHYKTFGERFWKLRIIDLSEAQVNALAHLTAWTVEQSAPKIERCLLSPDPQCGLETAIP